MTLISRLDPALIDLYACVRHGVASTAAVSPPRKGAVKGRYGADGTTGVRGEPQEFFVTAEQRAEKLDALGVPSLQEILEKDGGEKVAEVEIFTALQRIALEFDGLLRILVEHKELVVGDDGDRSALMTALMRSPGLLDLAMAAIERKDPELRQLSERQPPYDTVQPRKQGTNLTIEDSFVDDLRRLTPEQYSARLHSGDGADRTRAEADIHSLIYLLLRLLEASPFRHKVRLLAANRVLRDCNSEIESIYQVGGVLPDSRVKAEQLLQQKQAADTDEVLDDLETMLDHADGEEAAVLDEEPELSPVVASMVG